jgi:hypothetical protein
MSLVERTSYVHFFTFDINTDEENDKNVEVYILSYDDIRFLSIFLQCKRRKEGQRYYYAR